MNLSQSTIRPIRSNFQLMAHTQEEEDAYDYTKHRATTKPTGLIGSIGHLVKGALGGGILSAHVAYMKAGVGTAIFLNMLFALYITYSLLLLTRSACVLYKRTRVTKMTYPDLGEAAVACFPIDRVAKFAKTFRYTIDAIICIDLFGSCTCYQIIIAKSVKQLVENTQRTSLEGIQGYPGLRVYMVGLLIPIILICLITHLKWLAPFSILANIFILFCIVMTVYYAIEYNPEFKNMKLYTSPYSTMEFIGMNVFSMSCAGIVLSVENNMKEPGKIPVTLGIGMTIITFCVFMVSFFGYAGFLEACESPITVNFPMTILPKILKGCIAGMIYVTHALNFWVPFNLCFYYIKQCTCVSKHELLWELILRALFVIIICVIGIIFPTINALMGLLGCLCLANMALIWPHLIDLLVIWERPGLGRFKWRLWKAVLFILIGLFICVCGSVVSTLELISVAVSGSESQ